MAVGELRRNFQQRDLPNMRVITMVNHRMQFDPSAASDESDLDLIRFDRGCVLLGISLRTAYARLNDEASDLPRPFAIGGGRQRFFRRSDLVAYVARKAEEAQKGRQRRDAA